MGNNKHKGRSASPMLWPFSSEPSLQPLRSSSSLGLALSPKITNMEDARSQSPPQLREHELRRNMVLRDYHDQPFAERNYGAIRGLFETPARKIIRHEGIAFIGEFLGTFSFLYMAFMSAQVISTKGPHVKDDPEYVDKPALIMVAFGFGMALMVNVFIWFRVSGGQFNPAVSLGLLLMGAIKPARFLVVIFAQVLGAIFASLVVDALTVGHVRSVAALATSDGSRVSVVQGFFIEMIGTAQLILVIFFMAGEKHRATPMAPLVIGLTLFLIVLTAANYTGGSVNPVRALGPALIAKSYENLWLYLIAPFAGSLLATSIYALIKWAGYQDVNAGQDGISAPNADYVLPDHERGAGFANRF